MFKHFKTDDNKFWLEYYGVKNLSSYKLNRLDLEVLGKGLKYCPTPHSLRPWSTEGKHRQIL